MLNETYEVCDRAAKVQLATYCIKCLAAVQAGAIEHAVGEFQLTTRLWAKPSTSESHRVQAIHCRWTPRCQEKGGHILYEPRTPAYHAVGPNTDKLMHAGHTANHGPIFHFHMPSERRQAGHNHMIAQHTVVCDVGLRHDEIVRSQACTASRLHAALDDH